ncbi:hypothetical protein ABEB36_007778 [Hypothenemus hampei]|uniref:Transposable element P transposase n=1 Tax=Hypothenemus hampei TaxID=57062 RepID=A0ABD1EV39_HYPHA
MFEIFHKVQVIEQKNDGTTSNVMSKIKFIKGWKITINSLLNLFNDLKVDAKFICTRNLNQDALENMFGSIRSKGGANCVDDLNELMVKYNFSGDRVHKPLSTKLAPNIFGDLLQINVEEYSALDIPESNVLA